MKRIGFCEGWKFSRDGGAFESIAIPHDAMLGAYRGPDAPAGSASGYFGGGAYRYRKSFELTREQAAETVLLEFEGVYRDDVLAREIGHARHIRPAQCARRLGGCCVAHRREAGDHGAAR